MNSFPKQQAYEKFRSTYLLNQIDLHSNRKKIIQNISDFGALLGLLLVVVFCCYCYLVGRVVLFWFFFGEKENESMENCHENSELTKKLALLHREEKIHFNLIHVS